jgi:hypothetical protein
MPIVLIKQGVALRILFLRGLRMAREILHRWDWELTRRLAGGQIRKTHKETLGIAAIVKEEGPYIIEWIAWHRCLGVSKFFIADNVSMDGTSDLLIALHDKGIVTRIEWAMQPVPDLQVTAYKHIMETYGNAVDWLAFIDADEFFCPSALDADPVNSLLTWLRQLPTRVGAVAVNWANYGSSNRIEPGDGMVTERFFLRGQDSMPENRIVKSIVRTRFWSNARGSAHVFVIARRSFYINTSWSLLSPEELSMKKTSDVKYSAFRLNHYVVKSRMEYFAKKAARGNVNAKTQKYAGSFFMRFDKNEVFDPVPAEMLTLVKAEVSRIQALLADVPGDLGHLDRDLATLGQRISIPIGELGDLQ